MPATIMNEAQQKQLYRLRQEEADCIKSVDAIKESLKGAKEALEIASSEIRQFIDDCRSGQGNLLDDAAA